MKNLIIFAVLIVCLVAFTYYEAIPSPNEISSMYHSLFGQKLDSEQAVYPYKNEPDSKALYLDLMKLALTDSIYDSKYESVSAKRLGKIWPLHGLTMIGLKRLDNIQECMEDALKNRIPGDFIEAGAWRGGATIFMRAVLKANNETGRKVWVADSFEGMPKPDKSYPADVVDTSSMDVIAVSEEAVKENFRRFGLLDDHVSFLKGWFKNTLPVAPIKQLALLRVDADLYQSTLEALEYLYPKVSAGGYVIIDDYGVFPACQRATDYYRKQKSITDPIRDIDGIGVYWRRGS